MSVSGVSNNSSIFQLGNIAQTQKRHRDNDGDADRNVRGGRRDGGAFMNAITNALSQMGVGGSASTPTSGAASSGTASTSIASSSPSQDSAQALSGFMQSLMAALHSQAGQSTALSSTGTDSDGDNDGSGSPVQSDRGQRFEADLQSLIQQLPTTSDSSNISSGQGIPSLQQSFQTLVTTLGGTNPNVTLSNFLQALSGQMVGASTSGNAVKTSA